MNGCQYQCATALHLYLILHFDVFVQDAAQFVVVSIPLKGLLPSLLEEPLPVLRGAELLRSAR